MRHEEATFYVRNQDGNVVGQAEVVRGRLRQRLRNDAAHRGRVVNPPQWNSSIGTDAVLVPIFCHGEQTKAAFTLRGLVWCMHCHKRLRFLEPRKAA